jgi:hypothetical protein
LNPKIQSSLTLPVTTSSAAEPSNTCLRSEGALVPLGVVAQLFSRGGAARSVLHEPQGAMSTSDQQNANPAARPHAWAVRMDLVIPCSLFVELSSDTAR